jgi:two-component system KDP operon response regulator KdpE
MRILIADDESELAAALALYLQKAGHEVRTVTTGGLDVLPAYDLFRPDVLLMDIMMPRYNGLAIAQALLSREPAANLVLCSGAISAGHPGIGASGACRFLAKPFTFSEAKRVLEGALPAAKTVA